MSRHGHTQNILGNLYVFCLNVFHVLPLILLNKFIYRCTLQICIVISSHKQMMRLNELALNLIIIPVRKLVTSVVRVVASSSSIPNLLRFDLSNVNESTVSTTVHLNLKSSWCFLKTDAFVSRKFKVFILCMTIIVDIIVTTIMQFYHS